jgi:ABC-2 type transport system permease protein
MRAGSRDAGMSSRPSPIGLMAQREIQTRLQQRGYRIGVAITLIAVALAAFLPKVFRSSSATSYDIAVVGRDANTVAAALTPVAAARNVTVHVQHASADTARRNVRDGRWDAAVIDDAQVIATNADATAVALVQEAHQALTTIRRLQAAGVSPQQAISALTVAPLPVTATRSSESTQRQAIATITVVLLFGQLLTYCVWVANGVVEEKSSRVVELLLSAVRPVQLLTGKLLGIGTLAVAQVALVGVVAVAVARAAGTLTLPGSAYATVLVAFVGFVFGFALFAALCAALASTVSRQEELSGLLMPVNIIVTLSYLASLAVASSPDTTFARVLSVVPPVSTLAMPARIARGGVSILDIVIAVALLVVVTAGIIVVAGRIYRAAILHTGSKLPLRAAWRGEAVAGLS